jgi:hypothetical protein
MHLPMRIENNLLGSSPLHPIQRDIADNHNHESAKRKPQDDDALGKKLEGNSFTSWIEEEGSHIQHCVKDDASI